MLRGCSEGITVLLSYHGRGELEGKNVSILMPQPFSGRHNAYLNNFLTTGVAKILDQSRQVVALRKVRPLAAPRRALHSRILHSMAWHSTPCMAWCTTHSKLQSNREPQCHSFQKHTTLPATPTRNSRVWMMAGRRVTDTIQCRQIAS